MAKSRPGWVRAKMLIFALLVTTLPALGGGALGGGVALAGPAPHPMLKVTYGDPIADGRGPIDVTGMTLTWDTVTGSYTISLTADPAKPFTGKFRVDLNLYDPSAPATSSFFSRVCSKCNVFGGANKSDYDLGTTTQTSFTITGKDSTKTLVTWAAGHQVAANSWANLGNPAGVSLFRSSVEGFPDGFLNNEDVIGLDDSLCTSTGCPSGSTYAAATIVNA